MVVSEHALVGVEGFEVKTLGLGVATLAPVQAAQVDHGIESVRVMVSQHALSRLETFEVKLLGLFMAALVVVDTGQIVHRTQGVGMGLAQLMCKDYPELFEQWLRRIILTQADESPSQCVE